MRFVDKYSTFSKWFYLLVLGLAIPYYLLLYGASGHEFNPPKEDIFSMFAVVTAFVTFVVYLLLKDRSGSGANLIRILTAFTLLLTAYGGVRFFLFIVQFDYGNDISIFIRGLSYLIPLIFLLSIVI